MYTYMYTHTFKVFLRYLTNFPNVSSRVYRFLHCYPGFYYRQSFQCYLLYQFFWIYYFDGILRLRFYTKISLNPNVSVEQLAKRKTWKRSWWEIILREGFFRYCSCGNWRSQWHRDQLRFSVRWIEKKETCKEKSVGKTTLSFDITLQYFLYAAVRRKTPIEPMGSNF